MPVDGISSSGDLQLRIARLECELAEARTELAEAREQQAATSDILRVIATSPTDLQAILHTVAQNAARLCDAAYAIIYVHRVDGDLLVPAARYGSLVPIALPVSRGWVTGRTFVDRRTIHVRDVAAEADEFPDVQPHRRTAGQRAVLSTPLLRGQVDRDLRQPGRDRDREHPVVPGAARPQP
jgi:hypothetical protein